MFRTPSVELYRELDYLKSPKQILQRVESGVDCLDKQECSTCPLARLSMAPDNSRWLSCFDAVVGSRDDVTAEDIIGLYKDAARNALATLALEELIGEPDDPQDQPQRNEPDPLV